MNRVIAIRASSIGELFDCAARWEAKHLLGRKMPKSGNAQLGTAVHASTAKFDQSTIDGAGLTIEDCEGALVDEINKPKEDTIWDEELPAKTAEKIGLDLHRLYCNQIAPTQDYVAVEVKCESLEITDLGISLTGTTDRVRRSGEGYGIADIKTGKNAVRADGRVETAGHAMQQGVYELMAEKASGLEITESAQIIGLQTGKTERGQRAGVGYIDGARALLIGTEEEPGMLEYASRLIHTGTFPGNPNSYLCGEKYCPVFSTCRFRR